MTWSPDKTEMLRQLIAAGTTQILCAARLGLRLAQVKHKCRRLNLRKPFVLRLQPEPRQHASRRKAPPPAPAPSDNFQPRNITIHKLKKTHCRWVCGTDDDGWAMFCGHPICTNGQSWCQHHRKIGRQGKEGRHATGFTNSGGWHHP